ncbi:MAG TPA: alpha/beta hydrolase [Acidimicrobiales bacterium]|nr:alpha/beta hydrolase [Acidimicrobiales bacterium]
MSRFIDPVVASDLEAVPFNLELGSESLEVSRDFRARMLAAVQLSDDVERQDHVVAGDPDVTVRVYRPKGNDSVLPCVYAIHGGGYVMGTYDMEDLRFDSWCRSLGVAGVSVEYRLAPETPFPGPLEDCYAGLRWVFANADSLRIDPARTGICGTSAGGGLAAGLALLARDRGEVRPAFQMLIYPMLDDRQVTPSSGWDVPIWSPANNEFGWRSYLGDLYGTDRIPAYAAPARADDLSGLPPASVWVGTADGFCDEDILYAQRLNHAGVPTELHVYPGAPHGFEAFSPNAPVARRCRRDMKEWLASALGVGREKDPAV